MKYYVRRKEVIKCFFYLVLGVIGIIYITSQLEMINLKSMSANESVEVPIISVSEKDTSVNIEQLTNCYNLDIDEENMQLFVKAYLPGGHYFSGIDARIEENRKMIISYCTEQEEQILSKAKKDQIALVDASVMMGLYEELDSVEVEIKEKLDSYRKVFYRPDLEDYFGIRIYSKDNKNAFERIVKEFFDAEHVNNYWNRKHPYDSELGEDVENFYKLNFPVIRENENVFPYIDEALGHNLAEKYGYAFFVQGLKYENPLINYYCAYRLIEYFNTSYKEEIMLELANCEVHTKDGRVKNACKQVIDLMSKLNEDELRVFDRYKETTLGGGKTLYYIDQGGMKELARWEGSENVGMDVLSLSTHKDYLLGVAVSGERNYIYLIPTKSNKTYSLNEQGVYDKSSGELVEQSKELISLVGMNSSYLEEELKRSILDWYYDALIKIKVGEDSYIYDGKLGKLMTEEQFTQNFDLGYLKSFLDESFHYTVKKSNFYHETKADTSCIYIGEEKLVVREYDYLTQKSLELSRQKDKEQMLKGKRWSKGKIVINYSGNNQEIIRSLDSMMEEY